MGELYPPTAADYAWSAANDAKKENEELRHQVDGLRREMKSLRESVDRLWAFHRDGGRP